MLNWLVGLVLMSSAAPPPEPAPTSETRSLQGDTRAWTQHPALRAVWERLGVVCRQGCAKADAAAFEHDALELMQGMGPSLGMSPQKMRDHVKAIPRQLLQIGAEDPAILADYDKFIVALVGPA